VCFFFSFLDCFFLLNVLVIFVHYFYLLLTTMTFTACTFVVAIQ